MDEGTLTGPQVDPAFRLELLERFAHGLAADPEVVSQLPFAEVLPRLQLPADDHLEDGFEDREAQGHRTGDRAAFCSPGVPPLPELRVFLCDHPRRSFRIRFQLRRDGNSVI